MQSIFRQRNKIKLPIPAGCEISEAFLYAIVLERQVFAL